jgi:uncharacterized protein (TIGR02099 family)
MRQLWRAIEILAWAAFFAFAALVLALRFWLLPNIESYRGDIVAAASRAVGTPVKIGAIEAGWLGLRPQVSLFDVRIQDAQGREALVLPVVDNVLAWRSLLVGGLRLHSLAIERPRLAVRRDAAGVLYVAGIKVASEASGDHRAADWILAQEEILVHNAEIDWIDEKRAAPPLSLSGVELRLRNAGQEHLVGLSARPPAALGSGLDARAELSGRSADDLAAWNGRLYLELGYTDLAAWRAWVDYPVDVQRGQGALRLWATLAKGELTEATADLQLSGVAALLGKDLPPLELASVSGRVQATSRDGGYEIAGRKLVLAPERGPAMEPADFRLEWKPESKLPEHGALSAKLLQLEPLAQLAEALPLSPDLRKVLAELAPRGRLLDASLEWSGKLPEATKFTARTRFADLAINPRAGAPGFEGVTGSLDASESKGSVQLASRKAAVDLPQVFAEPRLRLDTLDGQIEWERKGERALSLRLPALSFANDDFAGKASGAYTYSGEGPGAIDLTASFSRVSGSQFQRYLPLPQIMGQALHDYLAGAIRAGQSNDTRLVLKGDLRDFPFLDPAKGQFQVTARVEKGELEYMSGWPRISDIDAELLFERDRMDIVARSGAILGARLADVRVSIPSMLSPPVHLLVTGQADGPTSEFIKYIESTPVQGMIGGATEGVIAAGRGKLRLKLDLPLADPKAIKVAGDYEFAANDVIVHAHLPPIERASGKLSFTESTLGVQDVTGRMFGGPVKINGGTRPDKSIEILGAGSATVVGLRTLFDHPWRRHLAGSAAYTAKIALQQGRIHVSVDSSLRGIASALPPPFAKSAAEALPLHLELAPSDGGARDRISLRLENVAAAELLRRRQGGSMAVQRATVWLTPDPGEPARLPERPGTLIYGTLGAFDFDRWQPFLDNKAEKAEKGDKAESATPDSLSLDLKIGVLDAYGKRVHDVSLRAGVDAAGWSASVQSEEASGDVSYRNEAAGHLVARLTQLRVPGDSPGARTEEPGRGKQLPSLDLITEHFAYRDKQFGRVEIKAEREGDDWRVEKLAMANPEATLSAKGLWRTAAPSTTSLQFELNATDAGGFLARLGYPALVLGGKARMQGDVSWNGDPPVIDYQTLSGEVQLQADDGQFLEIDPGIGKLISLMSLQALPRRLQLDFRDVFSKGFQFDRIAAASRIERGLMTIKDFKMTGSAADVEMSGELDLARETQNLKVRVIPSLGDTASAVLAVINPLLIFPAVIAQRILKDPLGHIFAFNYAVSGSWVDPKVVKTRAEARPVTELQGQ